MDWNAIKAEYITDESSSYRKLADKYGVSYTTIGIRARKEDWARAREQYLNKMLTKTLRTAESEEVNRVSRLLSVSDKLLARIEKIVDDKNTELAPATIDTLTKSLKSLKEIQRGDRDDERVQIDVVFGDGVGDYAK